ncbi:MAG: HD domain-containing protein, partial [Planctomycetes bacterium]|nr:HD domain-containing protein [Planctomycetota bacterium]
SVLVARKAREIARAYLERLPEAPIDLDFLSEAALLHDIGIHLCRAPEILCRGEEPYIRHGVLGKRILDELGLPRHGLVCARHTGSGISRDEVQAQGLPLPPDDYLPVSLEERVICAADKFYSKRPERLWREKAIASIDKSLARHGPASLERWRKLKRDLFLEE